MFRTRTPLSSFRRNSTARLACVRPPASVHPEPGSNSPLYVCPKLTQSYLRFSFSLLFWLLYLISMISSLFARRTLFLSFRPICECKSINYFLIDQIFFEKKFENLFNCLFFSSKNFQRFLLTLNLIL